MKDNNSNFRNYLSLILLFFPGILFLLFTVWLFVYDKFTIIDTRFIIPIEFFLIAFFGIVATIGGVLDWKFHRDPLKLNISKKERDAEAKALGFGGVPMFILMILATLSLNPNLYLIPIIIVLIYTVVAICYDEFVFHIHRCGKEETIYHRMLVLGNGAAWLSWIYFIYMP